MASTPSLIGFGDADSFYANAEQLKIWILARVWPKRYLPLEKAFLNFRRVLEDLINTFGIGANQFGPDRLGMTRNYNTK